MGVTSSTAVLRSYKGVLWRTECANTVCHTTPSGCRRPTRDMYTSNTLRHFTTPPCPGSADEGCEGHGLDWVVTAPELVMQYPLRGHLAWPTGSPAAPVLRRFGPLSLVLHQSRPLLDWVWDCLGGGTCAAQCALCRCNPVNNVVAIETQADLKPWLRKSATAGVFAQTHPL